MTTTSEQVVTAAGRTEELTTGSTMALDARLEEIGEDYRIIVLPELEAFEPAGSGYDGLALFRTQDTVNDRGEQRRFAPRRDIHDVLTLDAFSLPTLTLSVPDSMVGPGAVWIQTSRLPLVAVTTRTTVDAIDDTSVTVSKRITVGSDPEQRYAVTGRMSAVYSRDALLLRSADIELTLRFEDAVYINGRRERVVDDRTFRQALREISP